MNDGEGWEDRVTDGFRDMHAHFAYGLDDGAQTRENMEAMLDAAHADGIAYLYATPHAEPGIRPFNAALLQERLDEARAYCQRQGYDMTLYPGAEILYTPMMREYALEKQLPVLGDTKDVLIEFVPRITYEELEDAVAAAGRRGYRVILAHIERYHCLWVHHNAERLKRAHAVRYQVNGRSIVKAKGFRQRRLIRRWLRERLIDYVATDSHNCESRRTNMRETYRTLTKLVDQSYADQLTGLDGSLL